MLAGPVGLEPTSSRLTAECFSLFSTTDPLAVVVGIEPTTNRLTAGRSTSELHHNE